ncbi:hypothetical protein F8M41_017430 [Gigaspora margarita]|uniref:Uncharacterized protein n=1 Tax=Gigaspora margarita TaxID=4874 RepID=A0A8H4B5Q9_GIGMA|nr:hypothetical protein F8M41_017430 [Gigaspora margarita]
MTLSKIRKYQLAQEKQNTTNIKERLGITNDERISTTRGKKVLKYQPVPKEEPLTSTRERTTETDETNDKEMLTNTKKKTPSWTTPMTRKNLAKDKRKSTDANNEMDDTKLLSEKKININIF